MRLISRYIPRSTFLFVALIGAAMLLAACSGGAEPATTAAVPGASNSELSAPEGSPATEVSSEALSGAPEATSAPGASDSVSSSPEESPDTAAGSEAPSGAPEATSAPGATMTDQTPPTRKPASTYADLEVVTLLPPDAIPAIDNPQFLPADEADEFYDPDEMVMGVSFNGDSRAYSAPFLSNHEIVNDTVGGVKIAVTW